MPQETQCANNTAAPARLSHRHGAEKAAAVLGSCSREQILGFQGELNEDIGDSAAF